MSFFERMRRRLARKRRERQGAARRMSSLPRVRVAPLAA